MMSKKIYIVDSDSAYLHGMEARLRMDGHEVEADFGIDSNELIVHRIIKFSPHYLILDLAHDHNDVIDLLHKVKSDEELSVVPVFAFSSRSNKRDEELMDQLGVEYRYVKSHHSVDTFLRRVKKVLLNNDKRL